MGKKCKRVLFIHIDFYEYNQRIVDKLREFNYTLDCFCEDPQLKMLDRIFLEFNSQYRKIKSAKEQNKLIDTLSKTGIQYDYIFVIKGERLQNEFLMNLKGLNPKAKFILYLWDDVKRVSNFFENKELYDEIYSFDRKDSKEYDLKHLPLFFCDIFRNNGDIKKNIDVFFLGWDHSNRRQIIEWIIPILRKNKMNYYFHLYIGKSLRQKIKQMRSKKEPDYIKNNTLSLMKNAELTLHSKIVMDIQHASQSGLTMRTLETLAAKSKLITTNKSVEKYNFYNPKNILIINRENPAIDVEFLKTPYEDVSEDIVEKYSLSNWIETMFT